MKKPLLAFAILGASIGSAQADVTAYGSMDIGVVRKAGSETINKISRGNNNYLGFRGVEDLGDGLSAIFRIEMRFEPGTGTVEAGKNPLFQGRTVVGLAGKYGTIRAGRDQTAIQALLGDFEPWEGNSTAASKADAQFPDGYGSGAGIGDGSRFSNAIFYNTPNMNGFTGYASLATKEQDVAGERIKLDANPYSLAATYGNGPFVGILGSERNAKGDQLSVLGSSYQLGIVQMMGTYSHVKTNVGPNANGWTIGSNITVSPVGTVKVGYGRHKRRGAAPHKLASVGYQHKMSKRTFLYTDLALNTRSSGDNEKVFDVGIRHNF